MNYVISHALKTAKVADVKDSVVSVVMAVHKILTGLTVICAFMVNTEIIVSLSAQLIVQLTAVTDIRELVLTVLNIFRATRVMNASLVIIARTVICHVLTIAPIFPVTDITGVAPMVVWTAFLETNVV